MKTLHLTEDQNGISHFSEYDIVLDDSAFAPPAPPMLVSDVQTAKGVLFLTLPAGWGGAQHRSPRRQIAVCMRGKMRVEAGDGDVREIGPGEIWHMEDVTGEGHISQVIGDEPVDLMIVQLE